MERVNIEIPVISRYLESYSNKSVTDSVGTFGTDIYNIFNPVLDFLAWLVTSNPKVAVLIIVIAFLGSIALYKTNTISSSVSVIFFTIMIALIIFGIVYVMRV